MQNKYLEQLILRLDETNSKVEKEFGSLTKDELNWKPSPDKWSIGQCLDHIKVSNETYFPQIEEIISGKKRNSFFQSLPALPKLWGKIVKKTVSPDSVRKVKTFKVFYPSSSEIPATIINDFLNHQKKLIELMKKTDEVNHDKVIISSPVSKLITYRLKDAFIIIASHEERHFNQAARVKETAGFPLKH